MFAISILFYFAGAAIPFWINVGLFVLGWILQFVGRPREPVARDQSADDQPSARADAEQAVDVFYVKDLFGHKISHPGKIAAIEQALGARAEAARDDHAAVLLERLADRRGGEGGEEENGEDEEAVHAGEFTPFEARTSPPQETEGPM